MKTASSELSITIVAIIAIGAILTFLTIFLPQILEGVSDDWENTRDTEIDIN